MRFGPAGLGGVKEAVSNLEEYGRLGLKACEIAFTYGVYIKENDPEIDKIKETAKKLDIKLSIHAPYYINLNSKEKKKIEESKKRILECCKIGEKLGAERVVFHAGFYSGLDKETTFQNIKKAILELEEEIKKNKYKIKIAVETMGKVNVFGTAEEVLRLVKETGCEFCLDFAHLYAREIGKTTYKEIYEKFKNFDSLHVHFSGINYTNKGERSHKITEEKEIKKLLEILPKKETKKSCRISGCSETRSVSDITIINESPTSVEDSVKALKLWQKI